MLYVAAMARYMGFIRALRKVRHVRKWRCAIVHLFTFFVL